MNPLAELHERLAYTAAAGTALLDEDFRLKKIMEAFAPLAQKNPVFGKIHAGLTALFEAAPEQRGSLLLNLLGLVDAVLYTQAGCGAEGDFAEAAEHIAPGNLQQIRYSALCPLIAALTTTGSGRMEVLTSAITEHPEYLTDYRVIHALVSDLADPYGEMAVLVFRTLQALATGQPVYADTIVDGVSENRAYQLPQVDTEQMIFALKRGFDPEGKTEMRTRLMLVCAIRGGAENDWYLSLLDTAKKEIRALAIFALGFREENIPRLLELAEKERGKAKEMAYHALARWETPEVLAFFEKTLDKSPKLAVCLAGTASDAYGDLAAAHLQAALEKIMNEPHIPRKQMEDTISPWISALTNKASDGVIAFYEWVLDQHKKIPQIQDIDYNQKPKNSSMIPGLYQKICETLMLRCPQKLVDFLRRRWDGYLQEASFLADILTLPASDVYDKWSKMRRDDRLHNWMRQIGYNPQGRRTVDAGTGAPLVTRGVTSFDPLAVEPYTYMQRPMREPLDLRWLDIFMKNDWEDLFIRVGLHGLPEAWREKLGAYFYDKAMRIQKKTTGGYIYRDIFNLRLFLGRMHELGWQNYENILVNLCKAYINMTDDQLCEVFRYYKDCAGSENTEQEAKRVREFYRTASKNPETAERIWEMLKDNGFAKEA